jgi:hypothetical protein
MAKQSKKDKAIEIFKKHLQTLETIKDQHEGRFWKDAVFESIKFYLGTSSSFISSLREYSFTDKRMVDDVRSGWIKGQVPHYTYNPNKKERFKTLLNSIIDYINTNGIAEEKPKNIYTKYSFKTITGVLCSLIAGACALGFLFGGAFAKGDRSEEFSKLDNDYKILQRDHHDLKIFYERLRAGEDTFKTRVYRGIRIRDREIDSLKVLIPKPKKKAGQ